LFKKYIAVAPPSEVKELIKEGARLFGSINAFSYKLTFSKAHIYRWYHNDNNMSMKDFYEISSIVNKEKKLRSIK